MKKTKIVLELNTCQECPFFEKNECDSWAKYDWFCSKVDHKKIRGYVSWNEEDKVPVPEWCPIKIDDIDLIELFGNI